MKVKDCYNCCDNVVEDALFFLYDTPSAYVSRTAPIITDLYTDLAQCYTDRDVERFSVEDSGETVHVWVTPKP